MNRSAKMLLVLACSVWSVFPATAISAFPRENQAAEGLPLLHQVQRRIDTYDRRRDGPRFRTEKPGYTHFHEGYYYAVPWWEGVPVESLGGEGPKRGSAHVTWCLDRYRSYDPHTDTFLSFDGQRKRCNSPY